MEELKFCECESPNVFYIQPHDEFLCSDCGKPPECELSHLSDAPDKDGTPHAAETTHLDYVVCRKHLGIAVDNVHGRSMPDS